MVRQLTPGNARIPTPAEQSKAGESGGRKKLDANQLEAIWDEVQLHTRMTFRWKAPKEAA